jgi:hypothetical protein
MNADDYTGVDFVQEKFMGAGPQDNESAVEQAKDEQISDFIRGQYKSKFPSQSSPHLHFPITIINISMRRHWVMTNESQVPPVVTFLSKTRRPDLVKFLRRVRIGR